MFSKKQMAFAGALLAVAAIIAAASLKGEPKRKLSLKVESDASRLVEPAELADWIITGRRDFAVIDMRSSEQFQKSHIRQAVHCGTCHESKAEGAKAVKGETFVDLSKKLVFYTEGADEEVDLPRVLHDNPRLYRLSGGYARWQKDVLAPVSFEGLSDEDELAAAKKRESVRAYFSGERPAPAAARLPVAPIRRVGEHKGAAAASEGC